MFLYIHFKTSSIEQMAIQWARLGLDDTRICQVSQIIVLGADNRPLTTLVRTD